MIKPMAEETLQLLLRTPDLSDARACMLQRMLLPFFRFEKGGGELGKGVIVKVMDLAQQGFSLGFVKKWVRDLFA